MREEKKFKTKNKKCDLHIFGDSFGHWQNMENYSPSNRTTYLHLLENEYNLNHFALGGTGPEWAEEQLYNNNGNDYALFFVSNLDRQYLPDIQQEPKKQSSLWIEKDYTGKHKINMLNYYHYNAMPGKFDLRLRQFSLALRSSIQLSNFKKVLVFFVFESHKKYSYVFDCENVCVSNIIMEDIAALDKPNDILYASQTDLRPNHMNPYNHKEFAKYISAKLKGQNYDPKFKSMKYLQNKDLWL